MEAMKVLLFEQAGAPGQITIEETLAGIRKAAKEEEIVGIFRNVYFIAKTNSPLSLLEDNEGGLHKLVELSKGSIHNHYRSRKQGVEILGFIADSVKARF